MNDWSEVSEVSIKKICAAAAAAAVVVFQYSLGSRLISTQDRTGQDRTGYQLKVQSAVQKKKKKRETFECTFVFF